MTRNTKERRKEKKNCRRNKEKKMIKHMEKELRKGTEIPKRKSERKIRIGDEHIPK